MTLRELEHSGEGLVAVSRRLWANYEPHMQPYLDQAIDSPASSNYCLAGDP